MTWGQAASDRDARALVRRSKLIVPANMPRYVLSAARMPADAFELDLEDSIPLSEKDNARAALAEAIATLRPAGRPVLVRVDHDFATAVKDMRAAVVAGADGIAFPKAEDPGEIAFVDRFLTYLEGELGREVGSIEVTTAIETPAAFFKMNAILGASRRLTSVGFAAEDMAAELDVTLTDEGMERWVGNLTLVLAAAAHGIQPSGLLGRIGEYRDLESYERNARRSARVGFKGAGCIHPDQVPVLNRAFSPWPEEVDEARRVVAAMQAAGPRGSVAVDGKMADAATLTRARRLLARAAAIEALDARRHD
jgi:citrate lyase subunit beta / citryl-CoA lyase